MSSRRAQRAKRSAARPAAFRAQARAELAIVDAGAAGAEYTTELASFATTSQEAETSHEAEVLQVVEPPEALAAARGFAELVLADAGSDARIRLDRLPGGGAEFMRARAEQYADVRSDAGVAEGVAESVAEGRSTRVATCGERSCVVVVELLDAAAESLDADTREFPLVRSAVEENAAATLQQWWRVRC